MSFSMAGGDRRKLNIWIAMEFTDNRKTINEGHRGILIAIYLFLFFLIHFGRSMHFYSGTVRMVQSGEKFQLIRYFLQLECCLTNFFWLSRRQFTSPFFSLWITKSTIFYIFFKYLFTHRFKLFFLNGKKSFIWRICF